MHRYKKLILPFIIIALVPLSASTVVPELSPLNFKTRYEVKAGPAGIGRLLVTARETGMGYDLKIDTKTSGVARIFSREQSVATVHGTRREGQYLPSLYTSNSDKHDDDPDREVRLTYGENGTLVSRIRLPAPRKGSTYRPEVPMAQIGHAVDPITGFFMLRRQLRDAMAGGQRETSVMTYDGARLAALKVKVISRARIEVRGKYVNAINTVVTRQPIAGYTKKELGKFNNGDPVIHAYFSADDRFMPLMLSISLSFGDVKATLSEISKVK